MGQASSITDQLSDLFGSYKTNPGCVRAQAALLTVGARKCKASTMSEGEVTPVYLVTPVAWSF